MRRAKNGIKNEFLTWQKRLCAKIEKVGWGLTRPTSLMESNYMSCLLCPQFM